LMMETNSNNYLPPIYLYTSEKPNPKPLFVLPHMAISSMKMFGKTGEHLELGLSRGTAQIKAIAFYSSPESFTSVPKDGTHKDIVAHLEYDAFKGGVRLRLVDVL